MVAVTGLCFLSLTLRLLVASQLAMGIGEGFQEPHVVSTVCRGIAGRCPVIVASLIISMCSATGDFRAIVSLQHGLAQRSCTVSFVPCRVTPLSIVVWLRVDQDIDL